MEWIGASEAFDIWELEGGVSFSCDWVRLEGGRGGYIVCTVMGILAGSMSSRMGFKYW